MPEDAANEIPGIRQRNRLQVSIGKMSAEDVLDDNLYNHDPRTQFLNWSLMYTGAWDYPANSRGYTFGALFDYSTMFYAVRYGIFGAINCLHLSDAPETGAAEVERWAKFVQLDEISVSLTSESNQPDHTYRLRSLATQVNAGIHVELASQMFRELIAEESDVEGARLEALWRITLGALA